VLGYLIDLSLLSSQKSIVGHDGRLYSHVDGFYDSLCRTDSFDGSALSSDMSSAPKSTVFRVAGLPTDKAETDVLLTLTNTIRGLMTEDELKNIHFQTIGIPSCDGSDTSNALLDFKGGTPEFLSLLEREPLQDYQVEMGDVDINFDRHFFGFTQLYPTSPNHRVTAE
jgi:hypothetical protein